MCGSNEETSHGTNIDISIKGERKMSVDASDGSKGHIIPAQFEHVKQLVDDRYGTTSRIGYFATCDKELLAPVSCSGRTDNAHTAHRRERHQSRQDTKEVTFVNIEINTFGANEIPSHGTRN